MCVVSFPSSCVRRRRLGSMAASPKRISTLLGGGGVQSSRSSVSYYVEGIAAAASMEVKFFDSSPRFFGCLAFGNKIGGHQSLFQTILEAK